LSLILYNNLYNLYLAIIIAKEYKGVDHEISELNPNSTQWIVPKLGATWLDMHSVELVELMKSVANCNQLNNSGISVKKKLLVTDNTEPNILSTAILK